MSDFRISQLRDSSILILNADRSLIQEDPDYQRASDVWTLDKRQLLIDSVLNGYDIPKIYFHEFLPAKVVDGKTYKYAIIDGRQRLQAIWGFIDGDFPLAMGFDYIHDDKVKAGGLTYGELGRMYPRLKVQFDGSNLAIVTIQTRDIELIEDMFSRLNEAVPLNAAEKRNALGGPLPSVVREIAGTQFFKDRIPFKNARYRYLDLSTKFIYFEHMGGVTDTKKAYLDQFFIKFRKESPAVVARLLSKAKKTVGKLAKVFINNDPLLRSVGMITVFYLCFRAAIEEGWVDEIMRSDIEKFEKDRLANRAEAEKNEGMGEYELLEFDRLAQSPNDAVALRFRYRVLRKHLGHAIPDGKNQLEGD